MVPDLLRLAVGQAVCRHQYLSLMEAMLFHQSVGRWGEDAAKFAERLDAVEPWLCEWIRTDPSAEVRLAAVRLLASSAGRDRLEFLDHSLRLEKSPVAASSMLAALHAMHLQVDPANWRVVLAQFQTRLNPKELRFQAACCRLHIHGEALPDVVSELREQLYCPETQTASAALRVIAQYGQMLPGEQATRLWMSLLEAAEDFDCAAEIACQLLRAALGDRRDGWAELVLTSRWRDEESPSSLAILEDMLRMTWAGVYRSLTGRRLRLSASASRIPARDYPEVRAFPPRVDLDDAQHLAAVEALVRCPALWLGHTEVWRLFGLPADRFTLGATCEAARARASA